MTRSATVLAFLLCTLLQTDFAWSQRPLDFEGDLGLPEVVRFAELPRRMHLEPELRLPVHRRLVEQPHLDLWERVLRSPADQEILVDVVRAVERTHTEGLADVAHLSELLHEHLKKATNPITRQVCASALAGFERPEHAAAVAACCIPRFESLCLQVEPGLAAWGPDAIQEKWVQRITAPQDYSSVLVCLACDCLAKANVAEAGPTLLQLVRNSAEAYSVRQAAARALGTLGIQDAVEAAKEFHEGSVRERLLACSLLANTNSDRGIELLANLCDDSTNAVASVAWNAMLGVKPEQLEGRLAASVAHADSNVRTAAIRVMRELPTLKRCTMLHALTGDVHIGVRNLARIQLRNLALHKENWRDQILKDTGTALSDSDSPWQKLEQALILAGELRHSVWQPDALRLLRHSRAEVFVTAAWLLHLMPPEELAADIGTITIRKSKAASVAPRFLELVFLLQCAGVLQVEAVQPLCEENFAKGSHVEKRCAALWALGKINEGTADARLAKKLLERVFDDNPFDPEDNEVRRMCILALVSLGAQSEAESIRPARKKYGEDSLLGEAVRWAVAELGGEPIAPLKSKRLPVGDFPIRPL